jgi:diadenosine tetraphosphate (Ap4A) HIT family hydrolase
VWFAWFVDKQGGTFGAQTEVAIGGLSWSRPAPYDGPLTRQVRHVTNPTARKFGYPRTTIAETESWLVLLRPQQPAFGSLVLVCKEEAKAFSELSAAAFGDLKKAVDGIETLLRGAVAYERINYLMLMMVDLDVHFHVIPRYPGTREHDGKTFADAGWPGPPALAQNVPLGDDEAAALAADFAARWRT